MAYPEQTMEAEPDLANQVQQANVIYHNEIASQYETDASTALIFTREAQARIEETVRFLGQMTDKELFVDVGCGTGNVIKFARQVFDRAVGVDVSAGMLAVARARGLDVCLADGKMLPVASASADVISCFSVLHHLYALRPYFADFYRVLKPGGYLYSDFDPNGGSLVRRPLVLRMVRFLHRRLSELRSGRWESVAEDSRIARIQKLAEYHQNYTIGLTPAALRQDLTALGFREVELHFHFSTLVLPQNRRWPPGLARLQELAFPFVAIVARK